MGWRVDRDKAFTELEFPARCRVQRSAAETVRTRTTEPHEAPRRLVIRWTARTAIGYYYNDMGTIGRALGLDAALALRGLRGDWPSVMASVAMLALAFSLHTTVFTITDAMLFRGFPQVPRARELVFLQERDSRGLCCLSFADLVDWQAEAKSFQGIAGVGGTSIAFRDAQGRPMDLRVTTVGTNLFGLLGIAPQLGRDFTPADGRAGADPVLMLSDRVWHARFGGDPRVVGSRVQVDGRPAEIVGVMPAGFEFPMAATGGVWAPIVPTPDLMRRGLTAGAFTAAARLRAGVALEEARTELEAINRRLALAYPETNLDLVPTVVDHAQFTSGADARVIWGSLWAASALVLLIACANVANLTIVRTVGRWREFVTCLVLGAGRRRIVRQLLIESVLIASAAALLAWGLVGWSVAQWMTLAQSDFQAVDYRVTSGTLVYLLTVTTVSAGLLSLAPVLRVLRPDAFATLQGEARGVTAGRRTKRFVTALVSAQMALAVVLLAGAGVLVRSFTNIVGAETGVHDPASVLVGFLRLPSEAFPTPGSRLAFFARAEVQLQSVGGVERVSLAGGLPIKFPGARRTLEIEGRSADGKVAHAVTPTAPDYFGVLGARVIEGRDFTGADAVGARRVAIVNERFATLNWPGTSAIGKRLRAVDRDGAGAGEWREIVGVVANIKDADPLRQEFKPLVYVPLLQEPPARTAYFLARTTGPADRLVAVVRTALQALDANVSIERLDTLQWTFAFDRDYMDAEHSELGKYSKVAPTFAVIALLLAAAGLVAVLAHSVAHRTREIGVRMAIGATPADIRRMIQREGVRPVAAGLVLGIAAALAVNRVFQSQLVGVSSSDPVVMVTAPAALVLIALVACRIPLRQALRVDPAVALRRD